MMSGLHRATRSSVHLPVCSMLESDGVRSHTSQQYSGRHHRRQHFHGMRATLGAGTTSCAIPMCTIKCSFRMSVGTPANPKYWG